jgi:hypothetical protein
MGEEILMFQGRMRELEGHKLTRIVMQHGELFHLHLMLLSRRQYDVTPHEHLINLKHRKYRQWAVKTQKVASGQVPRQHQAPQ